MCKARRHHPVHYLQQKCVKNQIWSQKEQRIQIQRELHYENGFCADVLFVISVFLSFTNWSSTVTTTTWENNPQWNFSQCALFLWNRFVTLYARLASCNLYFCFQKLLTQSPHICHSDHSLAKIPKHLAQNVNIQFARIWVNISERKKFWPKYLEIGPILNKDAPLAQTQLASCRKNVKFPMMK